MADMNRSDFIELLLERAKAAGFEAAEAYLSEGSSFEVSVNRGELIRYSVAEEMNLGFRGLYEGRMGCASTQALDREAVEMLVTSARDSALLCESEDEEFIFEGSARYPDFDGAHPEIEALGAAEKIALARELEQRTLDFDPRVASVDDCALYTLRSDLRMVNSRGLDLRTRRDQMGAYVGAIARDGDRTGSASRDCFARDPAELDIGRLAREAAGEAVAFLDAASAPSGSYPVLLRPDAAAQLMAAFGSIFSADAAQKGLSLLAGREGQAVAAPCVSIADDPLLPQGRGSRRFDGEGVASRRTGVVEDGELRTLLHNLKTARKQGVQTTGNAARRSVAGPMTVAASNLCVAPGSLTPEEMRARLGGGILVTELMGLHSGANAVSGDFSLGAKGFLIENGGLGRAVNQITIAGNFLELMRGIEAVGNDPRCGSSRYVCPTMWVRALSVAGK